VGRPPGPAEGGLITPGARAHVGDLGVPPYRAADVAELPEGRVKTVACDVDAALGEALAHAGPALVEVMTDVELV
jgi:thiamine pyrophosphate-dependent acetolactate synthase large subunit-like protein